MMPTARFRRLPRRPKYRSLPNMIAVRVPATRMTTGLQNQQVIDIYLRSSAPARHQRRVSAARRKLQYSKPLGTTRRGGPDVFITQETLDEPAPSFTSTGHAWMDQVNRGEDPWGRTFLVSRLRLTLRVPSIRYAPLPPRRSGRVTRVKSPSTHSTSAQLSSVQVSIIGPRNYYRGTHDPDVSASRRCSPDFRVSSYSRF